MNHEFVLLNHRTHQALDIGEYAKFYALALKDKAWVTDQLLLRVVVEEAYSDDRLGNDAGFLYFAIKRIWEFVQGASESEIELTSDFDRVCEEFGNYMWTSRASRQWSRLRGLHNLRKNV